MKKLISFGLLSIFTFSFGLTALAQSGESLLEGDTRGRLDTQDQAFIEEAGLPDDIDLPEFLALIVKIVLSFLGIIFLILTIYAGLLWMTSAGNEEKISKAKTIMFSAIIGLIIVLSAYLLTIFLINFFSNAGGGSRPLGTSPGYEGS